MQLYVAYAVGIKVLRYLASRGFPVDTPPYRLYTCYLGTEIRCMLSKFTWESTTYCAMAQMVHQSSSHPKATTATTTTPLYQLYQLASLPRYCLLLHHHIES